MNDSHKTFELWIKVLTLGGVLIGGIWAYVQYIDSKEKEFYSTYWNQKLDLFVRVSQSAAIMSTTDSVEKFNTARAEYWQLFYGPLSLVEGPCVKNAMIAYSKCVPKQAIESATLLPMDHFQQPAYRLTIRLKDELGKGWKVPFAELELRQGSKQCDFSPECQ